MKMLMVLCAFVAFTTVTAMSFAQFSYCTSWCEPAYVEEEPGLGCPYAVGSQSYCESGTSCEESQTAIAGGCQGDEEPSATQCSSTSVTLIVYEFINESCFWSGVLESGSTTTNCRCLGYFETGNSTTVVVTSCYSRPCEYGSSDYLGGFRIA
jgi:hypothetical protein